MVNIEQYLCHTCTSPLWPQALETRNYERCLNEADASSSDEEKLTDGAMCVMESWKFGMEYIKVAHILCIVYLK